MIPDPGRPGGIPACRGTGHHARRAACPHSPGGLDRQAHRLPARLRPARIRGRILALTVISVTVATGHLLVLLASPVPFLPLLVSAFLFKSTFAIHCLLQVSSDIGSMIDQDIDEAKKMLPALVGRDTCTLTHAQASSAVIESLSENYVDSILSPFFYYLLFEPFGLGLEAALAFKAISTMDSMVGYKTRGLKELGFAGAKLDDLANFIPARSPSSSWPWPARETPQPR